MIRQGSNHLPEWRCTVKFLWRVMKIVFVGFLALYVILISLIHIWDIQQPIGDELVEKYVKLEVKDWGFNGQPAIPLNLTDYQRALIDRSIQVYHLNAWLSDRIPLRRTLPDYRDDRCMDVTDKKLPKASIIIMYYDDHHSVLLRCLYSIFTRSEFEYVQDILLVDVLTDHAKSKDNGLRALLHAHFDSYVRYLPYDTTTGHVSARSFGAYRAKGRVYVFLESSVEVTIGWLPPLLEPIAADERVCTLPTLDEIHYNTFAYTRMPSDRSGFNWKFNHKYLPLLPEQMKQFPAPYENPIMNGVIFAISAIWYWQLSPYDVGLSRSGGGKYELSFMMWMCGGRVLEVPCSRVGSVHKDVTWNVRSINETYQNYKRTVEVWMDEFKDTLYHYRGVLLKVDAGDLHNQQSFRKKMQCKPFKWYLNNVMPDFLKAYPPKMHFKYAHGIVKFLGSAKYCLIMAPNRHEPQNREHREETIITLDFCPLISKKVPFRFEWTYGYYFDIRQGSQCLEVSTNATLPTHPVVRHCHQKGGNQFWFYNFQTHTILHQPSNLCLEGNEELLYVFVNQCDLASRRQRWRFNYFNTSAYGILKENH